MLNRLDYSYNGESSIIHNINAKIKLLGLFIYIIVCLFKFNKVLFISNISIVFLLLLLSNISLLKYAKIVWKLKYVLVLGYFILLRMGMEVSEINILYFKLVFLILYIAMIVYTTTKEELGGSLSFMIDRINIVGFNMKGISLKITNIFVYFDCLIDSYNEIIIDIELKGKEYVNDSFITGLMLFIKNRKIILNNAKDKMNRRKKDMDYRLYNKRVKSKYKYSKKFNLFDYIYIVAVVLLIVFYIVKVR